MLNASEINLRLKLLREHGEKLLNITVALAELGSYYTVPRTKCRQSGILDTFATYKCPLTQTALLTIQEKRISLWELPWFTVMTLSNNDIKRPLWSTIQYISFPQPPSQRENSQKIETDMRSNPSVPPDSESPNTLLDHS